MVRQETVFWVDDNGNPRKEVTTYRTRRDGTEYVASVSNKAPEDAQTLTEAQYNELVNAARETAREARERIREAERAAREEREKLAGEAKDRADRVFEELTRIGVADDVAEIFADVVESSF